MMAAPLILIASIQASAAYAQPPLGTVDHSGHTMPLFNMIRIEGDYAAHDGGLFNWDVDGWIGGDRERVWLRSEGEIEGGLTENAEAQLYYGWNVDTFWDVLIGVRQDLEPDTTTYLAAGLVGLAPHFFETEATLFLSDDGHFSARFEQSVDLPITQSLIAEPWFEVNLSAQDVDARGIGAGVSDIEIGLQLRYEITRKFAPYLDLVWERKLDETAQIARASGRDVEETTLRVGLRVWF